MIKCMSKIYSFPADSERRRAIKDPIKARIHQNYSNK